MMHYREAFVYAVKSVCCAIGSAASTALAFMEHSLPAVQWIAALVAIGAGIASIRASIASRAAIKRGDRK